MGQVKKRLAVPFCKILNGKRIRLVKGELNSVDAAKKTADVGGKSK